MNVPTIILLVWLAFEALAVIFLVGRPRPTVTSGAAAVNVAIFGVLAWLVVIA